MDNAQDLDLAREVAVYFRVQTTRANSIITEIIQTVQQWRDMASQLGISAPERKRMEHAIRVADAKGG